MTFRNEATLDRAAEAFGDCAADETRQFLEIKAVSDTAQAVIDFAVVASVNEEADGVNVFSHECYELCLIISCDKHATFKY